MYASVVFYWLPTENRVLVKTRCVVSIKAYYDYIMDVNMFCFNL